MKKLFRLLSSILILLIIVFTLFYITDTISLMFNIECSKWAIYYYQVGTLTYVVISLTEYWKHNINIDKNVFSYTYYVLFWPYHLIKRF